MYVLCEAFIFSSNIFSQMHLWNHDFFFSSSANEDDNPLGEPSSSSSPSITGFDSDNQSATIDDVADKPHSHCWLKFQSISLPRPV
jgi:hypothetical protein